MMLTEPLIYSGILKKDALRDQVVVITGAGGGIGYEAARSLAWLGAKVVLAEISSTGKEAAAKINRELKSTPAMFIKTDVGSERSVRRMARNVLSHYGKVDIVLNNATIAPLGAVTDLPIRDWDQSYRVNLRGPVLMAQSFLPGMVKQNYGVFVCVTSEGLAYMGAYEALKAAQLHLSRTIEAELEATEVISFSIGPGMVPTDTALMGIKQLAAMHGKTVEDMMTLVKDHTISIEAAGAGLAASVVLAPQFKGQEIGANQALMLAGIDIVEKEPQSLRTLTKEEAELALILCSDVLTTLKEQSQGWQQRSMFERQWVIRDFKKHAGMPVEQWLEALSRLQHALEIHDMDAVFCSNAPIIKLAEYYQHLQELSKGFIKDAQQLEDSLRHVAGWQKAVEELVKLLA